MPYEKSGRPRKKRWLPGLDIVLILVGLVVAVVSAFKSDVDAAKVPSMVAIVVTALAALVGVAASTLHARAEQTRAAAEFQAVAAEAMATVERSVAPSRPSLEDEIAEVSGTLSAAVTRLRDISAKAQAFEGEVKQLVDRAEAAQALAMLNEEQAKKISVLLSERTERSLKDEIEKLKAAHAEQAERQRKSGTRVAVLTFAGGVILGVIGNVATNLVML